MKKWVYLLSGIIIGVVVTASSGAAVAQVKSLIGQKVTGEYTVNVNGKTLDDKGVVVNGRTNAPVRAISDAFGAQLTIEGKTINIVTTQEPASNNGSEASADNPYRGKTKKSLEEHKTSIISNILEPTKEGRDELLLEIEKLEKAGAPADGGAIELTKKQLVIYENDIAKYTAEVAQIDEALAELK